MAEQAGTRVVIRFRFDVPDQIIKQLDPGGRIMRKLYKRTAVRYRSEMQLRFNKFSRGGGNWPPLKNKRKRGAKNKASVLRDTSTLFNVLTPVFRSAPGSLEKDIPDGLRIGYGGNAKHQSGKVTIVQVAQWHQDGAGNLPKRKILVMPSDKLRKRVEKDAIELFEKDVKLKVDVDNA